MSKFLPDPFAQAIRSALTGTSGIIPAPNVLVIGSLLTVRTTQQIAIARSLTALGTLLAAINPFVTKTNLLSRTLVVTTMALAAVSANLTTTHSLTVVSPFVTKSPVVTSSLAVTTI
jgi:hypothetical protein